jgi:P2-related tail formation protein
VQVQTLDVWGNATCPNDMLPFDVALQCSATDPDSSTFPVDDRRVALCQPLAAAWCAGSPAAATCLLAPFLEHITVCEHDCIAQHGTINNRACDPNMLSVLQKVNQHVFSADADFICWAAGVLPQSVA